MSNRFNPLSTAVAAATASLLVVAGGCAMGTRTDDQTTGLSRESIQNSQAVVDPAGTGDSSTMPSPSTSSSSMNDSTQATAPADTSAYPSAPTSQSSQSNQTDTGMPASSDAQTSPPSAPISSSSTDYSRSSDTSPVINGANGSTNSSASTSSTGSTGSTGTSNSGNGSQPLPPRSDRN